MSETSNLPSITETTVKAKINIALTKHNFIIQSIQNEINSIEFIEDNMPTMSELIGKIKSANSVIEDVHKEGKKPYWDGCKLWDAAKNDLVSINNGLLNQLTIPYSKLAADIEQRRLTADKEKQRIQTIQSGIESNIISFSTQISQCQTNSELLDVERKINLEKSDSRKAKYVEFHGEAISKFESVLLPIIKLQKEKIKEREELERKIKEAENSNDAVKIDQLKEKKENIENEIQQNKVNVQQDALNTQQSFAIPVAEEVFPEIKTVNRISFEIVDVATAVKKCPELLSIEIKHREAQKVAMTLKEAGTFNDKSEVIVNGIKFFVDKSYK